MEIVKNISAVLGCITAILALITAIVKPFRQTIVNIFAKRSEYKELMDNVKEIKNKQDEAIKKQDATISRLDKIEKNVLDNESDRLKSELFACGNRCRRGIILYPEEMAHIREVYRKYSDVLHCNHDGTLEYEFILEYFNKLNLNSNNKTN